MKKVPLLLLIVTFLFVTVFQTTLVNGQVFAEAPFTSPLTPPLSSFMHRISGKILLKKFLWIGGFSKKTPAKNVPVKLRNVFTHETFDVQTDELGVYTFIVDDPGWYQITPQISKNTADIVAPPFRFVRLKKHDALHEDFHAIDLP